VFEAGAVGEPAALQVLTGVVEFVRVDFSQDDFPVLGQCRRRPVRRVAVARPELEDPLSVDGAGEQAEPPADRRTHRREPLAVGAGVHLFDDLVRSRRSVRANSSVTSGSGSLMALTTARGH